MSATSYSVENAKSNRSTCKVCKTKIDKDVLRIGTCAPGPGDYDMVSWRHLECQKKPKHLTDLSGLVGLSQLSSEDQDKVRVWWDSQNAPKSSPVKRKAPDGDAAGGSTAAMGDPKKMKASEIKAALKAHGLPTSGTKPEQVAVLQEVKQRQELEAKYGALSVNELKELLRLNSQLRSGDKATLLERCVDAHLYGCLPRCPLCGGGTLKVAYSQRYGHKGQGKFSCPGFYDDDEYKKCSFTATDGVERPAWKEQP